jgi:thioredoxin reductase (NADPH)
MDPLDLITKGFVKTGETVQSSSRFGTNMDEVFAVGDVREGSIKRVASAVGEGASVVSDVHRYLHASGARNELLGDSETKLLLVATSVA